VGGFGSGRWGWHTKATTVEDCRSLDLRRLAREGCFVAGYAGTQRWLRGADEVAAISLALVPLDSRLVLFLQYTMSQTGEKIDLPVRLETTSPRFGGTRWWGRCPLVINGQACNRRVAVLYMPPRAKYFGCRTCYKLAYRSSQDHDKRADALLKDPARLEAILSDTSSASLSDLSLALKTMRFGRV
jgi:hypothetical protein